MLTKSKIFRKFFFFKIKKKKMSGGMPRGSHNQNLKEIRALGSVIIATQTDGRLDGQISIS